MKDVRAGENQYETINEIMSVRSEIIQRQNYYKYTQIHIQIGQVRINMKLLMKLCQYSQK